MANNIFDNENKKLRENVIKFWQEEKCTDLTLNTPDGKSFKVHKIVICSASDYFREILNSDFTEINKNLTELILNIQSEDLKLVLEFIYTGKCDFIKQLDLSKAHSLYKTFNFLEMDEDIKEILYNHLQELIYHENCLTIWRFRDMEPFDRLQSKIKDYIKKNTFSFLQKNLPKLNVGEIFDILSNKDLDFRENEWLQIIKWVKINFDDRQRYLNDIFNKINFKNLTSKFVKNNILDDEILFKTNPDLKKIVKDAYSKLKSSESTYYYDLDKRQQRLLITEENFYEIRMTNEEIIRLNNFYRPPGFSATEFRENNIFFSGGFDRKSGFDSSKCEYFSKGRFHPLPPMTLKRSKHSSVYYNDKIYCCGGCKSNNEIEILDVNAIQWIQGPEMRFQTWVFGLIQKDAVLYAFNAGPNPLIQALDTRTDSWEMLSADTALCETTRIRTKAIVYKNKIYVFTTRKAYIYIIEHNHLREIYEYPSNISLRPFEVFEFNDMLCIFGKSDSTGFICLKFNETTNEFSSYLNFPSFSYDQEDLNIF